MTEDTISTTEKSYMAGLLQNAARNAPTIPNDTLPRYGMSFLLPLPLMNQKGSNFIGDFNPKIDGDPNKGNRININYYPPFEMIAFYGGRANIPFEKNPTYTDEVITPEEFDFSGYQSNAQQGRNFIERTARECAEVSENEFAELGYRKFQSLIGFHSNDVDKGLAACEKLFQLILPLRDEAFFPRGDQYIRIKNGFPFNAPFLDEIDVFLRKHSLKRIISAQLQPEIRKVAETLYTEIRDGVNNAIKIANRILNETEAEMKNPTGVKKGYDEPDLRFEDAPVPTDLYCLAHTNRTELDNKQLQASTNIGREIAGPIVEAVEGFKSALGANIPTTLPKDVMTSEEVQLLLEQQREEFEKRFSEMETRFTPDLTQTQISETDLPDKTPPKGRNK